MTQLSEFITLEEFERSDYALRHRIMNRMDTKQIVFAQGVCRQLDKVRKYYKSALIVSSGFRNRQVNTAIGGSDTSQHCKGQACDFTIVGHSVNEVFADIKNRKISGLEYDQLIWEYGAWVHMSYVEGKNRFEELKTVTKNGLTYYQAV